MTAEESNNRILWSGTGRGVLVDHGVKLGAELAVAAGIIVWGGMVRWRRS